MERLAALLAAAIAAAGSPAAQPQGRPLSCVPAPTCGCGIVVSGNACPNGGVHFFHELADGAPLQFDAGQGVVTATSNRARTNAFGRGPGESWTETYRHGGVDIEVRYSPGPNTCPMLPQGEQCEYFDVRARVLISGPEGTRSYSGVGACGC